MLQKVIVVLVGLVMSVVGALTPDGLFASPTDDAFGATANLSKVERTLATVRGGDGLAFAKVPVLWLEVDGRRVAEDAWGTGEVEELRFKVGVKDVEGAQLAVGDKLVPVKPTDVITIRTFRGDFAYRGMGTASGSVQLQGTVQTTLLNEGAATGKLRTEQQGGPRVESGSLAYVVLDTGKQLDTVARESGGARFVTEEARGRPGNVLAKWVKVDGKLIREYTWGDGQVGRIEFEPADGAAPGLVSFDGAPREAAAGAHVVVKEFVGEYLVFQAQGGLLRLKLDGYAEDVATGAPAGPLALPSGPGAPMAAFDVTPEQARTTDLLRFHDRSTDDGVVVFWRWDFGDGVVSALQDPTHRYARPGAYNVTLNVTDEDLRTTEISRVVLVRNADPAADFEWLPRVVTTDSLVAFTDLSVDADGAVVNWTWDFGDGQRSYSKSPTHQFRKSGTMSVTLTVVDDLGGRATSVKQVPVRNHPPVAAFEWAPLNPPTRVPVTFNSLSLDKDGRIVDWAWDFDGRPGPDASGPTVAHTFAAPGNHVVALTVTDDGGATDTVTTNIFVVNSAPTAHFEWDLTKTPTVQAPLRFYNRATDADGLVVLSEWTWGDGSTTRLVTQDAQRDARELPRNAQTDISVPPPPPDAEHQYSRPGEYTVELCVTDNFGARDCKNRTVNIDQSAPIADITITPTGPHYRDQLITFSTAGSRDPDGDPIVYRLLEFGDGTTTQNTTETHRYPSLGAYPVKLTVRDSTGREGRASATVYVVNRPPSARIGVSDATPSANQTITFTADEPEDIDGDVSQLTYTWTFQPAGATRTGRSVEFAFPTPGTGSAILVVSDADGGQSNQIIRAFDVNLAPPLASFTMSDDTPALNQNVTLTDTSTSLNGPILSREWVIGGTTVSTERTFVHQFAQGGSREIVLRVHDRTAQPGEARRTVFVNSPPTALASISPDGPYRPEQTLVFNDFSFDPDGPATITTRAWDFGDGTIIDDTDLVQVVHTYARAGEYVATLTVSDGDSTSVATLTVSIRGRAPIAKWHVDGTPPLIRGEPIAFVSDSFDPDGAPIVSHSWSWGGGPSVPGGATQTHVFETSGLHRVGLTVTDGQMASAQTGESHKYVRVGADHPLTVDVSALLPHGGLQDLRASVIDLNVQHSPLGAGFRAYPKSGLAGGPEHLQLTLPRGGWGAGDTLTLTLMDVRYMSAPLLVQVQLTDADGATGVLPVQFRLPLPLAPAVRAVADTSEPILDAGDETVYDLNEPFHGTGHVRYLDGVVGAGASVTVQLRFLPLTPVRDELGSDVNGNDVLGWCKAHETTAAEDGSFEWSVTASDCRLAQDDGHPLGTWQVRAIARKADAGNGVSEPHTFYVDPTGALAGGVLP